jgi:hypothetical protein
MHKLSVLTSWLVMPTLVAHFGQVFPNFWQYWFSTKFIKSIYQIKLNTSGKISCHQVTLVNIGIGHG